MHVSGVVLMATIPWGFVWKKTSLRDQGCRGQEGTRWV